MNSLEFLISVNAIEPKLVQCTYKRIYGDDALNDANKLSVRKSCIKRVILIAAAVILVFSFMACAIVFMRGWVTESTGEYSVLPSVQQCIKDSGYEPLLIDKFENGYSFQKGYLQQIHAFDEDGNESSMPKSFDFIYELDGATVRFSQINDSAPVEQQGEYQTTITGTKLFYSAYMNMVVPCGYELSDAQQEAVERGELYVSYISGGDIAAETHTVSNVSWSGSGMHCLLQQIDGPLTAEELLSMASSILK